MVEPQARVQEMIDCLRKRGYRLTPQRMAIVKILATSEQHLSAEQIYEEVRDDLPMTSLATVYKTVTLLKEMNQLLEIGFSDDSNRYDGRQPYPHPHLVCVRCRRIIDVDAGSFEELARQVGEQSGYHIVGQRLDFFGICLHCQQGAGSREH